MSAILTKVSIELANGQSVSYYAWQGMRISQFLDKNGISEENNQSGLSLAELHKKVTQAYVLSFVHKQEVLSTSKPTVSWQPKDKQFIIKGSVSYKLGYATKAQAYAHIAKRVELSEKSITAMKEAADKIAQEVKAK